MAETETRSQGHLRIATDALAYPFRRFGWWIMMMGCYAGLMALFYGRGVSGGRLFLIFALMAVIVRCYLTIIENTITGFGSETWQNDGLRTDGMYEDLANMFGVGALSWCPVFLLWFFGPGDAEWMGPVLTLLTGLGCEYFCMAVTGLVVMGGTQGAGPIFVFPAIWKSGGGYAFSSMVLMLVPWSFRAGFHAFGTDGGIAGSLAGAAAAAFLLIMQARLIGLVYQENKEAIGWE